ncbi:enoyl-CoA hydratase/isomerase family protein [Rhodoplanes sp. Z2-YC6860]|uniref:enoyl-CoA hydratase/isomerase family protein n=1 Tax=Rhodoplanes sp. Z2-YC6860 TaxID=674703 RepID=UPI00078D7F71|nr:enoyl-CoA hydratase/isomerase family protein [Rhodoplanes sp. Z2-YC6860]AMN40496.1 enoyl-CoA hydratase/isomerase [Rhodoplanes sp. Z2-YC6860]
MTQDILYSVDDSIATITINRPDRMNALTPEVQAEMHRRFDEADADPAVRVIILTGNGAAFCAGYDQGQKNEKGTRKSDPKGKSIAEFIEYWQRNDGGRVTQWTHMWRLGKPIIAAVNGWAMGGGFWYQIAADITIASDKAVFAQPEVRHISNSTFLLAALCGWKSANRWGLTGDHFDAQEALRIGMVNEVVPHDELMDRTRALAKRIATVPEPSVRLNKAITMLGIQASGLYSGLLLEGALGAMAHCSHNDYREKLFETQRNEGLKAYLQMRDGPFQPEPMGPRSKKGREARKNG